MNNVISTVIQFITKGAEKAASGISGVKNAADVTTRGMATLATSLGSMSGSLGKATSQVANFIFSVKQMGAVGGIIAGAQMAITQISEHFIKAADKMVEAAERLGNRISDNLEKMNNERMDGVKKALEEATTKAKEAASAFEALASSYLKIKQAKGETASSKSSAEISKLTLERSEKMSEAKSDEERARIGASYDVKIAEMKKQSVTEERARAVESAKEEEEIRKSQARRAIEDEKKALDAKMTAEETYKTDVDADNKKNLARSKAAMEEAEKAYAEAVNDRVRKEAESTAASERVLQAENARTEAVNEATRTVVEAKETERRLMEAQKLTAEAEKERLEAVRKSTDEAEKERIRQEKASILQEKSSILQGFRDSSKSQFETAFDLWRDPEAAASAVESDKKRSYDLKAFNKAVNRYGGKGKIDEYAALMRAGDEEGMQSRLEQWRKSSKFTPQVEQMVKAEAARQNENAAEKSLSQIEKNTAGLAQKLDQLLALK